MYHVPFAMGTACRLWPFPCFFPYIQGKWLIIIPFCLLTATSQSHHTTMREAANSSGFHDFGPRAHLQAADFFPWKWPANPPTSQPFPGKAPCVGELLTFPFLTSGAKPWPRSIPTVPTHSSTKALLPEQKKARQRSARLPKFSPSPSHLPLPPSPHQAGWHRSVYSGLRCPEYQCSPAMS